MPQTTAGGQRGVRTQGSGFPAPARPGRLLAYCGGLCVRFCLEDLKKEKLSKLPFWMIKIVSFFGLKGQARWRAWREEHSPVFVQTQFTLLLASLAGGGAGWGGPELVQKLPSYL